VNRYLLVDGNNLAESLDGLQSAHLIIVLLLIMAIVALIIWVAKRIRGRRK
jgi:flagellar biogenesis protein FliO